MSRAKHAPSRQCSPLCFIPQDGSQLNLPPSWLYNSPSSSCSSVRHMNRDVEMGRREILIGVQPEGETLQPCDGGDACQASCEAPGWYRGRDVYNATG